MKIAFYSPLLCIRGSSVSLYNYADYNEKLLGNESVIILSEQGVKKSDPIAMVHFVSRFRVKTFSDKKDMDSLLEEEKCNVLYCIKYGSNDGMLSEKIKNVVHCVFDMSQPHGDVYAGVSHALAKKFNKSLYVPHMIGLKPSLTRENLRKKLAIPENAVVFGRYGGQDTFATGETNFCWTVMGRILAERKDVFFLFINTPKLLEHERVLYLDKITSDEEKNRFICTCDAHLECGVLGQSFGCAIGEFSVNNKPIICYKSDNLWNTSHLEILGEKGIYFETEEDFYNVLNNFNPKDYLEKDMNCYREFTPEKVMETFDRIFLK